MNRNGFTIIELMFCLAFVAVITAFILPSFHNLLKQQQVKGQINNLVVMIYRARSEAIKRQQVVTICKSSDSETCGGSWSDGWIMFEDLNSDGNKNTGEPKITSGQIEYNYTLRFSAFGSTNYIRFLQTGLTSYHNGTFTLCPESKNKQLAKAVIFSKTARVRTSKDEDNDGIDENASGEDLICH